MSCTATHPYLQYPTYPLDSSTTALPHPNQVSHFNPLNLHTCGYCQGDVTHRFVYCIALTGLRDRIDDVCNLIDPGFEQSSISINPLTLKLRQPSDPTVVRRSKSNDRTYFGPYFLIAKGVF